MSPPSVKTVLLHVFHWQAAIKNLPAKCQLHRSRNMTACKLCFELLLDFFDRSLPWGGEKDNQPEVCVRCQNSIKKPKKDFLKWKKKRDEGQSVILRVWNEKGGNSTGLDNHRCQQAALHQWNQLWWCDMTTTPVITTRSAATQPCLIRSNSCGPVSGKWKKIWKHKSKETHFVLKRSLFTPFLLQLC